MKVRVWLNQITFSGGTAVTLGPKDVVIIVGPNNSGKSATLRSIDERFKNPDTSSAVVKTIEIAKEGSVDDLKAWLADNIPVKENYPGNYIYQMLNNGIRLEDVTFPWSQGTSSLRTLGGFFCNLLSTEDRLRAANAQSSVSFTKENPRHPIHLLQRNDELEHEVSAEFRKAFGVDVVVHRNAGSTVPLLIGSRPIPRAGEDRVSHRYILELEKLANVETQGDGMRSFLGILLFALTGRESLLLVDEPEAFLHPPQARHLGAILTKDRGRERQLILATHSADILRGALDSKNPHIRVIRLRRSGDDTLVKELNSAEITNVWSDPLLRYSNIFDGLFHEKVVLCESDADCRFYSAVTDSITEAAGPEQRRTDILFTHCGGKGRLPVVIRALRSLDVPLSVVADFDIINAEQPLRNIVEAAGGEWNVLEADWLQVKTSIDKKKAELSTEEVRKEIELILSQSAGALFPPTAKRKIQEVLRRSSPWSLAKTAGLAYVPNGQPTQACLKLFNKLETLGIFIVPVGELESFVRCIGDHGPGWASEVIKLDLARDERLSDARKFTSRILGNLFVPPVLASSD